MFVAPENHVYTKFVTMHFTDYPMGFFKMFMVAFE